MRWPKTGRSSSNSITRKQPSPPRAGFFMFLKMKELTGIFRWMKFNPDGVWKWPEGNENLLKNPWWGYSEKGVGDVVLVKSTNSKNKRWGVLRFCASDLKDHTCEYCGRRGRRGFISDCYLVELEKSKILCLGCRSRYHSMLDKIEKCRVLGIKARSNLRKLKGIIDEASKNNARAS